MNYVSKHSRDHAASEYVSCVKLDRERAQFIGNKQTNMHTQKHSTLYIKGLQNQHEAEITDDVP